MEGVLAAFAQFDNDCRSDRTRAGMKAALEFGRWPFLAPLGYLNAPRGIGKSLVPDPERAPIFRRSYLKCRRENSTPDPDFRYFSNFRACVSSANFTVTSTVHGRCFAVCEQRPAL